MLPTPLPAPLTIAVAEAPLLFTVKVAAVDKLPPVTVPLALIVTPLTALCDVKVPAVIVPVADRLTV